MQTYSDFFKTLHDETKPTGYLGRGTHYSILRAVTFQDGRGQPLSEGHFTDFAVIWDEDHDTRVIEPIEKIYLKGLLSSFLMFGERKGFFTAILSGNAVSRRPMRPGIADAHITLVKSEITTICQSLNDPWPSEVVDHHGGISIISDEDQKVRLYLKNLEMLWQLGTVTPRLVESTNTEQSVVN